MFSVSTAVFDGHPLEAGLDLLARLGVLAVEPAFIQGYVDFDETAFAPLATASISDKIRARGLSVQALSAHMDLSQPDAVPMLARRIDCAARLGAPVLITNAGPEAEWPRILEVLRAAAPRAADAGVIIALENPGHGQGDLIGTGVKGATRIQMVDHPAVRLNIDVGNYATYGGGIDPLADINTALAYAAHVHLKDYAVSGQDWIFTALGQGDIDFDRLPPKLCHLPIGIELPLRLRRPNRGDPRRGAPLSMAAIEDAIRKSLLVVGRDRRK